MFGRGQNGTISAPVVLYLHLGDCKRGFPVINAFTDYGWNTEIIDYRLALLSV